MPNVLSSLFPTIPATTSASAPIDIKSLFDKLVNTGIIKQEPDTKPVTTKAEVVKPPEYIIPQKKVFWNIRLLHSCFNIFNLMNTVLF